MKRILENPFIALHGVSKAYGDTPVLKGIDLAVGRGEVVCIIGPSGSGKSTVLRCINALAEIDGGQIRLDGALIGSPQLPLQQLRQRVGIVFQSYNLFPHRTVLQNVSMAPIQVLGRDRHTVEEEARALLRQVRLGDKEQAYPGELSGGQQQRVAIARSLAMQPKVMLFDEVTSALDPQLTGEVLRVMEDLAKGGMTMIVVTHEMAFARKVANRVIYMNTGRVWETGTGDMLVRPETQELKEFLANGL